MTYRSLYVINTTVSMKQSKNELDGSANLPTSTITTATCRSDSCPFLLGLMERTVVLMGVYRIDRRIGESGDTGSKLRNARTKLNADNDNTAFEDMRLAA